MRSFIMSKNRLTADGVVLRLARKTVLRLVLRRVTGHYSTVLRRVTGSYGLPVNIVLQFYTPFIGCKTVRRLLGG